MDIAGIFSLLHIEVEHHAKTSDPHRASIKYMKKLVAILLCSVFAQVASAQHLFAPIAINLIGTYSTSNQVSKTSDVEVYAAHTQVFSSKSILTLIGDASGMDFAGYVLVFDVTSGDLIATNHATGEGQDLSAYVQVQQPATNVQSGTVNNSLGSYDTVQRGMMTITFTNNTGTSFTLSGLARITTTQTPTTAVVTTQAYILSLSCVGQGTYQGLTTVYTGTITASGRITYDNF
jgi:hypothetical protein